MSVNTVSRYLRADAGLIPPISAVRTGKAEAYAPYCNNAGKQVTSNLGISGTKFRLKATKVPNPRFTAGFIVRK